MTRNLRIDSSSHPIAEASRSWELAGKIAARLKAQHSDAETINRDLSDTDPPRIQHDTIDAFRTQHDRLNDAHKDASALSDTLIAALKAWLACTTRPPVAETYPPNQRP